jgi:taurine dioxygenase
MSVVVTPLGQGFGAVISGFDAQHGSDVAQIEALRRGYAEHHLLVLRGCGRLSPARQATIVGWFGPLSPDSGDHGEKAMMMDNADERGRARLPFHSDITFFRYPIEGISLHALELPRVPTSTTFVSNALAWDTLEPRLQADLADRTCRHYYADDQGMELGGTVFEHWHPVRLPHYRTGRPVLFVTEHHVELIEGYSAEESRVLLDRLFAHVYAPERQYEHVWELGDLVIWDNYAIQHARAREARLEDGPRKLQRVALGTHGFSDQFESLRRKAERDPA